MTHLIALALTLALGQPAGPLRIVVLEGEDAVNVVQQKTAVRPLVEVRDRNNVPVSGATVTFTIGKGQPAAFAGGAQSMTVTTNAAGQAAANGFNVVGAGPVQIQVQAAFQGLIATAAISQTAVAAAATAAGAGATSAGATAGGAVAGGAGGGLSLTTIGIIGGVVAGGAVVATQTGVLGGGGDGYTGSLSGQYVWTNSGSTAIGTPVVCNFTRSITGNMTFELDGDGASGKGTLSMTHTDVAVSGTAGCGNNPNPPLDVRLSRDFAVSGGPSALAFTHTEQTNQGGVARTDNYTFNGSLSGSTITGTLSWNTRSQTTAGGNTFTGTGAFTIPVTLQR